MGRVQVTVRHARRLAETTAKNSLARLATLSVFLYCSLDFSVTESVKYQTHVDYLYSAQKNLGDGWCVYNFILYALVQGSSSQVCRQPDARMASVQRWSGMQTWVKRQHHE
jgi:predicted nucleotide-binding protein (sugar kinase/HSP70/actin superfamily)